LNLAPAPATGAAAKEKRGGLLGYLGLDRADVWAAAALLLVAFTIRFFSPIFPDLFAHPDRWPPVTNCVRSTPVDAQGDAGTLCGLAYPFTRGHVPQDRPTESPQPPEGEVFDEIYFGVFAHNDLKGIPYFDPEPPLAKEVIAAGEWLYGWYRATFEGAKGDYADLGFNTFGWRLSVMVFGSLTVPLMYLLARRLWDYRLFAVAAGVLTCFDGMFFVQSRIGMIDMIPIFLILLSYWVFLIHLNSRKATDSLLTLSLLGIVVGLAIAAKWISLAAWGTFIFFITVRALRRRVDLVIRTERGTWSWGGGEGPTLPGGAHWLAYLPVAVAALVAVPLAIYVGSWFPFFMRGQFHTLNDLWQYQKDTFTYHATLTAGHPYGSVWWSWPFLFRPVAYYYESGSLGLDQVSGQQLVAGIVNLGNPWIWWTSLPCLVLLPYFIFKHRSFPAALIAVGFLTQFLPWSRVTRVIFLYHMFGGLIFMILALAFVLAQVAREPGGWALNLGERRLVLAPRHLVYAHLALAVLFFAYFYPVWTGLPISADSYLRGFPEGKMWFPTWI
jgi:dolichyl-phosphate-mannose--protein O-mannosyl transferase